ncbi:Mob1/phocein [Boeremia exigua]|uniref:Mob1/phocein n=1 Tax=Boeremia exigua TaxID=749465 RepID=UPI001E8DCD90|nr:Mob1/phocein [Boeremia exigua]KAH6612122.1 Mob1/phocein [Boeremia exigua]
MVATAMTSPASPRLPSPPPIAEDQLSPVPASPEQQKFFSNLDHAAARRIRPGTKAEDMAEGPPLVELSEIDSAFQLTEHLKALHNFLTHPIGANGNIPVDKEMALKLAQPPENVDKTLWLYELCRFLTQKVNSIIVALFSDTPPCSAITCPEMRASEWQYLCAVHDPPKSCCAIDYCCHTLDWAANTLTSPKHFPSRLALGTDQSTQHSQIRQLTNIFRRVYRIFAHAWFQHREMFWKVEGDTGLYIFFKTVCDVYGLIPEDNYTIPPEAEGIEPLTEALASLPPLILKREPSDSAQEKESSGIMEGISEHSLSTAGTTKRHRHSPSVGAMSVATVVEEVEEEDGSSGKEAPRPVTQIFESTPEDPEEDQPEQPEETKDAGIVTSEEATSDKPPAAHEVEEASSESTGTTDKTEAETDANDEAKDKESTTEEPVAEAESKSAGFLELTPEEHQTTSDDSGKPAESTEKPEKTEADAEKAEQKDEVVSGAADKVDKADKAEDSTEKTEA